MIDGYQDDANDEGSIKGPTHYGFGKTEGEPFGFHIYSSNRTIVSLAKMFPTDKPRDGTAYSSGGTLISARYSSPT